MIFRRRRCMVNDCEAKACRFNAVLSATINDHSYAFNLALCVEHSYWLSNDCAADPKIRPVEPLQYVGEYGPERPCAP